MKKEQIYVVIDDEPKRLRAIQILTDAKEEIFSGSILLEGINSYYINLHFSTDWSLSASDHKTEITLDQLEQMLNPNFVVKEVHLSLDDLQKQAESLGFDLVKKERQIKVGDFGKFWGGNEKKGHYGFLTSELVNGFLVDNDTHFAYSNFRHLTDEEKQAITENW